MWYRQQANGFMLQVKVVPRAKQNKIIGVTGNFLKIAITAVPEKGRANNALAHFLATVLDVPPSTVVVVKGSNRPEKMFFVPVTMERLRGVLQPYSIIV
jgi:uncharacterized protein